MHIDSVKCDGTGPVSRQLQDKVGGVAPVGLFSMQIDACRTLL
jgi:hypothetical protein